MKGLIPDLDNRTEEAARYVATTYDRLGFILKHDRKLERGFGMECRCYSRYVDDDKAAYQEEMAATESAICFGI